MIIQNLTQLHIRFLNLSYSVRLKQITTKMVEVNENLKDATEKIVRNVISLISGDSQLTH